MPTGTIRQLIYQSRATGPVDADGILQASRHNNALDGITGLLWFDGTHFVQVLEGPEESVRTAYERIAADPRHEALELLSDRRLDKAEFGYWSMELGDRIDTKDEVRARLTRRLGDLPLALQALFDR